MGKSIAEGRNQSGARGSSRKLRESNKVPFGSHVFRRIELTEDEKNDCKQDYLPNNNPLAVLADLAVVGYKFSYVVADDGKTHMTSLTCTAADDPNAGGIISARAGDLSSSIIVLGYKVLVVCGDDLWSEVEQRRGGGYSDIG